MLASYSNIDRVRQALEDGSLVVALMDWENETYLLQALLPSTAFHTKSGAGVGGVFGGEVCDD
ncbi:MAG: hypothetical protein V4495_18295 [Pseudomonadota bacterium]